MSVTSFAYLAYAFFPFYPQANDISETHSLVPATVQCILLKNMQLLYFKNFLSSKHKLNIYLVNETKGNYRQKRLNRMEWTITDSANLHFVTDERDTEM
jgi:hypothetical protein